MKLVHCSYHKCLTVYYSRVISTLYNDILKYSSGYKHFNSWLERFYKESDSFKMASINNHALNMQRLGTDCRVSRFVRDPRDLVVSGYFFHKRGAEWWCNIVDPGMSDWELVNGCVPESIGKGESFSSHLQRLSKEDGLIAEIEFRSKHFQSMMQWPTDDPRIKVYKYEDTINNEINVFKDIFDFYELGMIEKKIGVFLAKKFSANRQEAKTKHIRDPAPSQWKSHFTPRVQQYFERKYGELLIRYGYNER